MNVGVVGCGNVSDVYLRNCKRFDILSLVACADLDAGRAKAKAEQFDVLSSGTTDELLADPRVECVLTLTRPDSHFEIARRALEAGKHVYNEKPLALRREDGLRLLELAKSKGLRVGAAPDTFMGAGLQMCRKLIDAGHIGEPVAATAFMLCRGHESWHPDPEFFYQEGGGPLFDMGPYYLTALVNLMGPVARVSALARTTFGERTITSEAKSGQKISVRTPTHISATLEFASGAIGTLVVSFDVWCDELPRIEIYGADGTLSVPDPNEFGGTVRMRPSKAKAWRKVNLLHGYGENSRGVGLADMARAIKSDRPHRASGELACHVLDVMQSILESAAAGRAVEVATRCEKPARMPEGLAFGQLDD